MGKTSGLQPPQQIFRYQCSTARLMDKVAIPLEYTFTIFLQCEKFFIPDEG